MPETTMYEDGHAMLGQDYVGSARQPFVVHTEAESRRMEVLTDTQLRKRVLRSDAGHHA